MGLGQLAIPPLSACSQRPWEALAAGGGRTVLTHEEKTGGNCPSSSNYPRQIKTQDMEAYLDLVKQEKAEKGLGGLKGWGLVVGTEA